MSGYELVSSSHEPPDETVFHPKRQRVPRDRRIIVFSSLALVVLLLIWASSGTSGSGGGKSSAAFTFLDDFTGATDDERPAGLTTRDEKVRSMYAMERFRDRSWLDHYRHLNQEGLAPATVFAQEYLYHSQNPPLERCKDAQYYFWDTGDTWDEAHGLGSAIHVASYALFRAVESHRILMWDDLYAFGRAFVDDGCLVDGIKSLDCIFEPLSHCPREHMTKNNTVVGGKLDPPHGWDDIWTGAIPTVFAEELNRVLPFPITTQAAKFWWRGQAAAYYLRLNQPSLDYISSLRLNTDLHQAFTVSDNKAIVKKAFPFPLPRGIVSMHIRHGDKGKEMELHPLSDYVAKGEEVARLNPHGFSKQAYLSSEDPTVFEEAQNITRLSDDETTSNMDWIWYTSSIKRLNDGPFAQLHQFGNRTETTLSWMAELLLAMECDAFVGTLGSNWNRLIAELRCIFVDKCQHPYLEVGPLRDWGGYNW